MDDHLGLNAPSTAGIWQNKYHPSLIFPYNAQLKGNNSSALLQDTTSQDLICFTYFFFNLQHSCSVMVQILNHVKCQRANGARKIQKMSTTVHILFRLSVRTKLVCSVQLSRQFR